MAQYIRKDGGNDGNFKILTEAEKREEDENAGIAICALIVAVLAGFGMYIAVGDMSTPMHKIAVIGTGILGAFLGGYFARFILIMIGLAIAGAVAWWFLGWLFG